MHIPAQVEPCAPHHYWHLSPLQEQLGRSQGVPEISFFLAGGEKLSLGVAYVA